MRRNWHKIDLQRMVVTSFQKPQNPGKSGGIMMIPKEHFRRSAGHHFRCWDDDIKIVALNLQV